MTLAHSSTQQPIGDIALGNAIMIRSGRRQLLPQGENLAFRQAILDCAAGEAVLRSAPSRALEALAGWWTAVEADSPELAGYLWDGYFRPFLNQLKRRQFRATSRRLRATLPGADQPTARRVRLAQLRAGLDDAGETDPSCAATGTAQAVDPELLHFLKLFVSQTELARRSSGGPALSEPAWAWKVWQYLEHSEPFRAWLQERLTRDGPAASGRSLPGESPGDDASGTPRSRSQLRLGIVRFFQLEPLLGSQAVSQTVNPAAGDAVSSAPRRPLSNDEIRRLSQVEVLLATVCPGAAPLVAPEVYAQPLLRAVQRARQELAGHRIASSPRGRRAAWVLSELESYYANYQPWRPLLKGKRLGKFPQDAVQKWRELICCLAEDGPTLFRQRTIQFQLVRAMKAAILPHQSELSRLLCASEDLLRQWDTERVGLGRRRRGDLHTELATFGLKLRGRASHLRKSRTAGPLPPRVAEPAERLDDAVAELIEVSFRDEDNSENRSFAVLSLLGNTIQPEFRRLENAVRSISPMLGDPEVVQRAAAVRDAAERLVWTAEDLADGFHRARRNLGLRWLLEHRAGGRRDDVLSRE